MTPYTFSMVVAHLGNSGYAMIRHDKRTFTAEVGKASAAQLQIVQEFADANFP